MKNPIHSTTYLAESKALYLPVFNLKNVLTALVCIWLALPAFACVETATSATTAHTSVLTTTKKKKEGFLKRLITRIEESKEISKFGRFLTYFLLSAVGAVGLAIYSNSLATAVYAGFFAGSGAALLSLGLMSVAIVFLVLTIKAYFDEKNK